MPPLRRDQRDQRDQRDRRANTKRLIFEDSFVNWTHFSVKDVHFSLKSTKIKNIRKVHAQKSQGRHFSEKKRLRQAHRSRGGWGGQYVTKSMMYSRKIKVFKCQYVHFAHIRLSFGCTDEKIDLGICLHTYTRFSCCFNSKLKSWNAHGHIFRISQNPDRPQNQISESSLRVSYMFL